MNNEHPNCGPECYEAEASLIKAVNANNKRFWTVEIDIAETIKTASLASITSIDIELHNTPNLDPAAKSNMVLSIMSYADDYIKACEKIYEAETALIKLRLEEAGIK